MAAKAKRVPRRRGAKAARRAAAEAGAPEPGAAGFDEPASPPPRPNPSIEEPTTPAMLEGEPEEACGLPGRTKIPASDLH